MDRMSSLQRLVLNEVTPRAIVDLPDGECCIVLDLIDGNSEPSRIAPDVEPSTEGKTGLDRQSRLWRSHSHGHPRTFLRDCLSRRFDEEELRTLCFDAGVSYDGLGGRGTTGKARELVEHFERRNAVLRLLAVIESTRPDVYRDLPTQVIRAYRETELGTSAFEGRERTRGSTRRIDKS